MNPVIHFNREMAVKGGESNFINESGAYTGRIAEAKWMFPRNGESRAAALELSFEAVDGSKANYLSLYYLKRDGTSNDSGEAMIHAIMALTGVTTALNSVQNGAEFFCPELKGKPIGLALQKVLFTKNNGSDGYKFEIKFPFSAQTRQTLKEMETQLPPSRVDSFASTISDKDDRTTAKAQSSSHHHSSSLDDDLNDIPM